MGLLAGAALARGEVQDYGFLFVVFDPGLLIPADQFADQVSQLIDRIKATPRQPGVEEIRIPSERAFRERDRRRVEGLVLERKVVEALTALASPEVRRIRVGAGRKTPWARGKTHWRSGVSRTSWSRRTISSCDKPMACNRPM